MKKIVVLFFILLKVNAQYCKVVYNVVPTYGTIEQPSNVSAENQKFVQNMVAGADETLKTMFYNLVVNNKISIFEIEKLKLKSNPNYYAMISATNDVFYTTNDTLYRLTNKSGSKVAIILNPRNNWILENESKTINSYKCFKAHIEVMRRVPVSHCV